MTTRLSFARTALVFSIFSFHLAAASAADWPLAQSKLTVPSAAYSGRASSAPVHDCQPEDSFDPKIASYRESSPANAASAVPATYRAEGADATTRLTINSFIKKDDARIELSTPYKLTRYIFACEGGSTSEVLEFDKAGKRNAIFTHVSQMRFTPGQDHLVIYNYAKPRHGGWQEMRRIYDVHARRFAALPMIRESAYLADVNTANIVTYGLPRGQDKPGVIALWDMKGKLVQAFGATLPMDPKGKAPNVSAGLLPGEPSTLYLLVRTAENEATLHLQDLKRADGRRKLKLALPGAVNAALASGTLYQLDLSAVRLGGGAAKYRLSPAANGSDWGDWQTAE